MSRPFQTLSFRAAERLHRSVEKVSASFGLRKTEYLRQVVTEDCALWRKCPHVCLGSDNLLLVDGRGTFHYWQKNHIRVNEDTPTITMRLEMKHRKVAYYLSERQSRQGGDTGAFVRRFWRFNRFCVSSVDGGRVLHEVIDDDGITSKAATFRLDVPKSTELIVESAVVLDDYVQWFDRERDVATALDSVEVDVLVPTARFDLLVVLDKALYGQTRRFPARPKRALSFSLQDLSGGRLPELSYREWGVKKMAFEGAPFSGGAVFEPDDPEAPTPALAPYMAALAGFTAPSLAPPPLDQCLGYRIHAPRARQGIRFAVEWLKPERVSADGCTT